jgi:hypothetical protein
LRKWDFGTDPFGGPAREEDRAGKLFNGDDVQEEEGDGFSFLQESELTRLDLGRVGRRKPRLGESIRPSRGTKEEDFRWTFKGVGEEEYRSLSMASLVSLSPSVRVQVLRVKDFANRERGGR